MKKILFEIAKHNNEVENKKLFYRSPLSKIDKDTKNLIASIKQNGWWDTVSNRRKRHPSFSYTSKGMGSGAFIGKNFVVKRPYITESRNPPSKYVKCPTKIVMRDVWLQPTCIVFDDLPKDVKKYYIDQGIVSSEGYLRKTNGYDAHSQNFGLLNGKLVQFDW